MIILYFKDYVTFSTLCALKMWIEPRGDDRFHWQPYALMKVYCFLYSDILLLSLSINLHHADRFSAFPVEAFQRASVLISCFVGYYAPLRHLHSESVPPRETLSLSHVASNNIARRIFIRIWESKDLLSSLSCLHGIYHSPLVLTHKTWCSTQSRKCQQNKMFTG